MKTQYNMIGVDVAKAKLDIAIDNQSVITINNTEAGFKKLLKTLTTTESVCFAMEASGGYEKALVNFLLEKDIAVAVINAKRVRDYAKAMGMYAKTDRIDALMIREYAEMAYAKGKLQLREARSNVQLHLEALLRRRHQLVEQRKVETQHLNGVADNDVIRSIKRNIKNIGREIETIEAKINKYLDNDDGLKKTVTRLNGVKGIGNISALMLVSQLPELGQVSNKEIVALVGLAPFCNDSGQKNGRRAIFGGRGLVRSTLYMATLAATRYNAAIRAFYQRLLAKGKLKKVALTACMRKLLCILNSITKKEVEWEQDFAKSA